MASNRSYDNDVLSGLSNVVEASLKRSIVCCPNCDNWQARKETCGLNNQRPPAPIIAFGCECYIGNKVPF